jgi:opacity protein-like surface antigen
VRTAPSPAISAAVLAALLCVLPGRVPGAVGDARAADAVHRDLAIPCQEADEEVDRAPGSGDRDGLRHVGFRVGYGYSNRESVQVIPLYVHAGWLFPEVVDAPLRSLNLDLEYLLEGWIGGVTGGPQDAIEVGINPIGFKLSYDAGQTVVPYFSGGLGVLYTGLQGIELGGPFEFNETAGLGVEIFLEKGLALTIGYRYRHVSNAGIKDDNRGLDTHFGTIGLSWYPRR